MILEALDSVSRDYKGDITAGFLYFNSGLLPLFNYLYYIHLLIIYILLLLLYNHIYDLVLYSLACFFCCCFIYTLIMSLQEGLKYFIEWKWFILDLVEMGLNSRI